MAVSDFLTSAVKSFEGFTARASWDYKQNSIGYGTKASSPGEVIDKATASARLNTELTSAQSSVDAFAPGLPSGVRDALTSLTFNAGPGWQNAGLGSAVQQGLQTGDFSKAQQVFQQYNKAGGQVLPGLVDRRATEASWFGQHTNPNAVEYTQSPQSNALFGDAPAWGDPIAAQGAPVNLTEGAGQTAVKAVTPWEGATSSDYLFGSPTDYTTSGASPTGTFAPPPGASADQGAAAASAGSQVTGAAVDKAQAGAQGTPGSVPVAIVTAGNQQSQATANAANTQAAADLKANNDKIVADAKLQTQQQSFVSNWAIRIFLFIIGAIFVGVGLAMFAGKEVTEYVMPNKKAA